MKYEKGSFITIPNKYKLRELSLGARVVFVELCDMSDEHGLCFPSRSTLAKRLKKHENSVDSYITELCDAGILKKQLQTRKDGGYTSNLYQIIVIPLPASCDTPLPASCELTVSSINSNHFLSETNVSQGSNDKEELRIDDDSPIRRPPPPKGKYPHAREVFGWFPWRQPSWKVNKTECENAEFLYARGESKVKAAIAYCIDHRDDEHFYQITKPSDLERKWLDLLEYRRKNG